MSADKIVVKNNDVVSFLGIRGTGKTFAATWLHQKVISKLPAKNIGVVLSTKNDKHDLKMWREYGYEIVTPEKLSKSKRRLRCVEFTPREDLTIKEQAQRVIDWCNKRGNVIILIDEYTQVCASSINPGEALFESFARGRGLMVGVYGCAQEPAYIPRQLMAEATHLFLFDCPGPKDFKVIREQFNPDYVRPPDKHGFFYQWREGRKDWGYYKDIDEFAKFIKE